MTDLIAICVPGTDGPECISPPVGIPTGGLSGPGSTVLQNSIIILFTLAVVLVLIFLLWAAIRWITSGGDKQKLQSARSGIIYAIVGLVVVFFAFFLINILGYFFGIKLYGK